MRKNFISSVLSGILIGIADYIYLNTENKIVGAFLFAIALITIIYRKLNLYTGKIGYLEFSRESVFNTFIILIGNVLGLYLILYPAYNDLYVKLFTNKLSTPIGSVFIKSIICGMLMYISVSCPRDKENSAIHWIFPIFGVSAFILSGCEHCIADIGYLIISRSFNIESINFILEVIVGNSLGGIIFHRLLKATE